MSNNVLNCSLCGKCFTSMKLFEEHHADEHSESLLSCSSCEKKFRDLDLKYRHENAHALNQHSCKFCGKLRKDEIDLYIHLTVKHKYGNEFKCNVCTKKFAYKKKLRDHITTSYTDKLPSIMQQMKSFCTVHSDQMYFYHSVLEHEIPGLNISETQENDVSGGNFSYTGHDQKTDLCQSSNNSEDHQSVSNNKEETETKTLTEQKESLDSSKRSAFNPDKN